MDWEPPRGFLVRKILHDMILMLGEKICTQKNQMPHLFLPNTITNQLDKGEGGWVGRLFFELTPTQTLGLDMKEICFRRYSKPFQISKQIDIQRV